MTAQHASQFDLLTLELWLAQRLRQHGARITDGVTTREERRERARAAILAHGLETVVVGRREGKPCTYAEAFVRVYGEPLIKSTTRNVPRETSEPQSGG